MTTNKTMTIVAWAVAAVLSSATGLAQQASASAGAQAGQVERYVVGQAKPPEVPGVAVRNVSLQDAYAIALDNNLELKVARMNPQGVDYQIQGANAAFDSRLTGTYSYNNATTTSNFSVDGVSTVTTLNQNGNTALAKAMPWYGGNLSLNFRNGRSSSNQVTNRFNPSFSTSLDVSYTQPLLEGFKIDATRNTVRTLQITRQVVDLQLETTIENTKAAVRQAYWTLRGAIEQIEIQRRALELAQRLYEDNKIRVEIGTMAPIETTTSETQVVNAEQALVNAEISWQTAELALKRLLASGPEDELYRTTINPVDLPTYEPPAVQPAEAVRSSLDQRLDLVQARRNIDISRLNLEVSKNTTLPTLDTTATYRLAGTSGGYADTWVSMYSLDNPTWSFSFNFTYPLGMKQAKANLARSQLQFDQSLASLKSQELSVANEVFNAGLAVQNTYKQLQVAIKAAEVSQRNADAEQVRFDVGLSDNYNVAIALNNLTTARLTELSRTIAYINAVAEFERAKRYGR